MSRANPRFRRNNPIPNPLPANAPVIRYTVKMTGPTGVYEVQRTWVDYTNTAITSGDESILYNGLWAGGLNLTSFLAATQAGDVKIDHIVADYPTLLTVPVTTHTVAVTGTVAGFTVDPPVGATLIWETNFKGQCGRGRMTLPVPENFVTSGAGVTDKINNAGLVAIGNFANPSIGVLTIGGHVWTPSVIGRTANPAGTLPHFLPKGIWHAVPIITYLTNDVLGTARRRKAGRGI
jgi:hypothetical protein